VARRLAAVVATVSLAVLGLGGVGCHDSQPPAQTVPPKAPASANASTGVELVRHQVQVDGHAFAIHHKSGPQPRNVIVLVHGRTWSAVPDFDLQVPGERRSFMDGLVTEGFATYAVDLRGYGGTPRDDTGWLTPDRAAADLTELVRWVSGRHPDLGKPVLFGWSYGSLVSQLAVQRDPQLASDLILFGYPGDPGHQFPPSAKAPGVPPNKVNTAEAAASDFIVPDVISEAAIAAYVKACLAADVTRVDWTGLDQWNALDASKVTVPTLLIHGEHDPYAPMDRQARLFQGLGNADRAWVIVAGGDHAAHLENTQPRFVQAVVSFVRRPGR
jgi:pimeloyl-ACP methyl ester carboxylesterase